jgi:hypothetical protein
LSLDLTERHISATMVAVLPPSSRGLGHRPFKAATGIRIPLGAHMSPFSIMWAMEWDRFNHSERSLFSVVENTEIT